MVENLVVFSYLLADMEPLLYAVLEKYWTTNICMDDQCQCFICSYWIYIHIRMFHVSQDESSCTDNNFGFVMDTVDLWNSNVTFALICRGLFFLIHINYLIKPLVAKNSQWRPMISRLRYVSRYKLYRRHLQRHISGVGIHLYQLMVCRYNGFCRLTISWCIGAVV